MEVDADPLRREDLQCHDLGGWGNPELRPIYMPGLLIRARDGLAFREVTLIVLGYVTCCLAQKMWIDRV
jgi:hypothetical protein